MNAATVFAMSSAKARGAGQRITRYFDDADQLRRAWKLARRNGGRPTRLPDLPACPPGDFITDAGEFANWLKGRE